jgi:hypothetical protein
MSQSTIKLARKLSLTNTGLLKKTNKPAKIKVKKNKNDDLAVILLNLQKIQKN